MVGRTAVTAIDELLAKQTIYELCATYMHGLDRLQMDVVRGVFHDDATTDYGNYEGGPDGFIDYARAFLETLRGTHHLMGQALIDVDKDVAFGEVYFQAFHRVPGDPDEDLFISGRYVDRYERRSGAWRIAHRTLLTDWARRETAADQSMRPGYVRGARGDDDLANRRVELRQR